MILLGGMPTVATEYQMWSHQNLDCRESPVLKVLPSALLCVTCSGREERIESLILNCIFIYYTNRELPVGYLSVDVLHMKLVFVFLCAIMISQFSELFS